MSSIASEQLEHIVNDVCPKLYNDGTFKQHYDALHLLNGTVLSVQASSFHYCIPKRDSGPYTHVEVLVCNGSAPESWDGQNSGWGHEHDLFGYLPVSALRHFIETAEAGWIATRDYIERQRTSVQHSPFARWAFVAGMVLSLVVASCA